MAPLPNYRPSIWETGSLLLFSRPSLQRHCFREAFALWRITCCRLRFVDRGLCPRERQSAPRGGLLGLFQQRRNFTSARRLICISRTCKWISSAPDAPIEPEFSAGHSKFAGANFTKFYLHWSGTALPLPVAAVQRWSTATYWISL